MKVCSGCKKPSVIWKSEGRDKYCRQCWSCHNPSKVGQTSKPRSTKLAPRSSRQSKKEALYAILRKAYLKDHNMCEAHLPDCGTYATDIHHKAGRGVYFLDSTTYMAVCRSCHQWIELHPIEAKQMNFSVERLKPRQNEDED